MAQGQVSMNLPTMLVGRKTSNNPHTTLSNPSGDKNSLIGGWRAGKGGVYVARFAWVDPNDTTTLINQGSGAPDAIIVNEQRGTYFDVLNEVSLLVPEGQGVTAATGIDIAVVVSDGTPVRGQPVFVDEATGKPMTSGSQATGFYFTGNFMSAPYAASGSVVAEISTNVIANKIQASGSQPPVSKPLAWVDSAYNADGSVKTAPTGGKTPYKFAFQGTATGASINADSGVITATDAKTGFTGTVSVVVTDAASATATSSSNSIAIAGTQSTQGGK